MTNSFAGRPRPRAACGRLRRTSIISSVRRWSRWRRTAAGVSARRCPSAEALMGPCSRIRRATRARVVRSAWFGPNAGTPAGAGEVLVVSVMYFTTSVWPNSFPPHKRNAVTYLTKAPLTNLRLLRRPQPPGAPEGGDGGPGQEGSARAGHRGRQTGHDAQGAEQGDADGAADLPSGAIN